jgi:hypothetical protein
VQGQAGVDDVFDDDHVAAFDARIEVFCQAYFAGRRSGGAVAGTGDEVDADVAFGGADQIAEEQEGALEDADEVQLPGRQVVADFLGERMDASEQFVLIDQDGRGCCRRHCATD